MEIDENPKQTAIREVKEETGVEGKILKALSPVDYWFVLEGDPSAGSGREVGTSAGSGFVIGLR